jgi:hypothetical protein
MTKELELRMRKSEHYGSVARACDERMAPPVACLPQNLGAANVIVLMQGQAERTSA